jgi:hypothetical protein
MKTSSINGRAIPTKTVDRYVREANGQFFNASGSGFESNDPNFYASGGAVSTQEPYRIEITNSGVAAETAIIFGAFKYLNVSRFGSGANTTVAMGVGGVSYAQLLQQSGNEPFEVVLTRIETSDATQLKTSMLLKTQDASGAAQSRPLTVSSYQSPMQYQNNMIDVAQNYRIDGNTWIEYSIRPSVTVSISFFVSAKVNVAKPLNGQAPIEEFGAQRLRTFTNGN